MRFGTSLLKRHPNLLIDNCASGGRRIDLETIGRSTPFWRTDGPRDAIAHQCHTYGLMPWVPLSATSQDREGDDYEFRSSMCSALCINWAHSGDGPCERLPENFPFAWAKTGAGSVSPNCASTTMATSTRSRAIPRPRMSGWPTNWTAPPRAKAWWWHCAALKALTPRPASPARTGPEGAPIASRTSIPSSTRDYSGSALARDGLEVAIQSKPGSALLTYEAVK